MKFRPLFFIFSLSLLVLSIFSIIKWQFRPSIDFVGGTIYEFTLPNANTGQIKTIFKSQNLNLNSISQHQSTFLLKFDNITQEQKLTLQAEFKKINPALVELRFETLGPSIGRELLQKTIVAIFLSAITLLFFIGSRFRDLSFGLSAILAMFHDSIILLGAFSLLGHFFGAELDTLFVTALLTTLSASVHDTIVTFDRIRELRQQQSRLSPVEMANKAVTEVLVRSINNSMTIIFMLTSLVVLGGVTTRWFAIALLIGVVSGTYSSIGVAIPLVLFLKKKSF